MTSQMHLRGPAPDPDPVIAARPIGSDIETQDGPYGLATATFDPTRMYRYRLSRVWDPTAARVNFLMLNPSTADAFVLDRTVRHCVGYAQAWDAGALEVTNAYAFRATRPRDMKTAADPVGPGNDDAIVAAARAADLLVLAWGTHATYRGREAHLLELLAAIGARPQRLAITKGGHPRHPLYVPRSAVLSPHPLS